MRDVYKTSVYSTNPKRTPTSTPVSQPRVAEKKTVKPSQQEKTDKPVVVAKSEVQKDQRRIQFNIIKRMIAQDLPTEKYIVPPPEKGYSRKIREVFVSNLDDRFCYFVDNELIGTRFPYLQKLAQLAAHGSYDLLPIFKATSVVRLDFYGPAEEAMPIIADEAFRLYTDVLRLYDYVSSAQLPPDNPVVTEDKLDAELKTERQISDFDFDSLIQDEERYRKELQRLLSLPPDRTPRFKISAWIRKHEDFFSSGDSKLKSTKTTPKRGAPGYMRVN